MTRCLGYATLLGDTTPLSVKMQSGFAVGILHLSGVFGVCGRELDLRAARCLTYSSVMLFTTCAVS